MFVPQKSLNVRYPLTDLCRQGEDQKRRQLVEDEARVGASTVLSAYGIPLAPVSSFKYPGIVLLEAYKDYPVILCTLSSARQKWAWVTRVLGGEVLYA